MNVITIYNSSMQKVAYLENAFAIGYEEQLNNVWNATFSLPATDEKNEECQPFRYVEIYDGDARVDLFRIIPAKTQRSSDGATVTYSCEHVLATLLDDIMFQYHQIGGAGIPIGSVIAYILSKQSTVRWQLGTVEFSTEFEYNYENENLLSALFAATEPISDYQWAWDTKTYPWTLHLRRAETAVSAYIRYGKNLSGITVDEDPTQLVTRIYPLGYGEGVNQLTIKDVNPTGLPYIDADTIGQYGVIAVPYVDQSIDNAATLYAVTAAALEKLKRPKRTYTVDGAELYRLTNDPLDKFRSGSLVRVIDQELGIDFVDRVTVRKRGDVNRAPGDVQLQISNKVEDIATGIASLANRQRIQETYAQGATNIDSQTFADNCDATHPLRMRVYIPEEAVRINKVLLSLRTEAFRAYEQATGGGGASVVSSGPSTKVTTGPSSTETTENVAVIINTLGTIEYQAGNWISGVISSGGGHNHGIPDGTNLQSTTGNKTFSAVGDHSHATLYHKHNFMSDPHSHRMDHTHEMDHTHQIALPNHTHDLLFGIYEGNKPNSITVTVDGTAIPGIGTSIESLDISSYLSVDANGKINRGSWHEITVTPNGLGRIVATVISQLFVQSRGGGDY